MPTTIDYTNKQLIRLIWPLILEQFLSIAVGLADSIMVAQVGEAAVSGVSLVDSISVLMVYIFSAMAAGGAAVCGQYIGRSGYKDARSAGQHLVLLSIMMSAAITILLYVFRGLIVTRLFGSIDSTVMDATNTYYRIVMASIPGIAVYNAGAAIFRAMGRTRITLGISILMNAINVGGNAFLIFGLGCGVEGVAIPTLVSRWVAAIVITLLLFNKKYELHLSDLKHFRFRKRIFRNIISLGIPGGIENGMFQLGKIVLFSYISTMGTACITANAVGGSIALLNVLMGMSINLALVTVVSCCIGAGAYEKAKYYYRKLVLWTYAVTAVWIGIILLCLPTILKIYNVSPEATELAYQIEMIHGICTIFLWTPAFMTPTFLKSAGDASYTMIVSTATMWIGRVGGSYLLGSAFGMGVIGVWIAHAVIDWIARGVFFNIRYFSGKWKEKGIR